MKREGKCGGERMCKKVGERGSEERVDGVRGLKESE